MSTTATQTSPTGTGLITHATAVVRGTIDADVSVYHARTDHARIAVIWGGVLINIFSAAAARGLLEAFTAARQAAASVPRKIPPPSGTTPQYARPIVAMEFTYRTTYVVVPQSGEARSGDRAIHWGRPAHRRDHLADPRPGRPAQRYRTAAAGLHHRGGGVPGWSRARLSLDPLMSWS
jgi:hypothetical protein